ncbi:MAG: class I SAM-dependent methyltransferase [Bryobacteraceae bacterium]
MEQIKRTYLPAAGRNWALPLYDPLVKALGGDSARKSLIDQADPQPGHRILDIGCGTGTLATLIKRLHPGVDVVGLDPDPKALARARKKAGRTGVSIQLDQGYSDELPYPDASFDRVFSSFMFHHLQAEDREKTLREVRRVLKDGGSFHMLDFARKEAHNAGGFARWLHSSDRMKENTDTRILTLIRQAGFSDSFRVKEGTIFFGRLHTAYYQASKPGANRI